MLTEMDGDGNGAIDLAEMREWFMDFEEGGGGLLGIALRNELDQALEVRGLYLASCACLSHVIRSGCWPRTSRVVKTAACVVRRTNDDVYAGRIRSALDAEINAFLDSDSDKEGD